jgi:phosphoribosylpyrophosphate synthetase
MSRELMIFSGNANLALAHEICAYLGAKLGEATVSSFSDGEIRIKIEENVRGADVYVVQSTCCPVNDSLMELLIMIDALKRSSAYRITAVMPYFGYARQDRKDQPLAGAAGLHHEKESQRLGHCLTRRWRRGACPRVCQAPTGPSGYHRQTS